MKEELTNEDLELIMNYSKWLRYQGLDLDDRCKSTIILFKEFYKIIFFYSKKWLIFVL